MLPSTHADLVGVGARAVGARGAAAGAVGARSPSAASSTSDSVAKAKAPPHGASCAVIMETFHRRRLLPSPVRSPAGVGVSPRGGSAGPLSPPCPRSASDGPDDRLGGAWMWPRAGAPPAKGGQEDPDLTPQGGPGPFPLHRMGSPREVRIAWPAVQERPHLSNIGRGRHEYCEETLRPGKGRPAEGDGGRRGSVV